MKRIKFLILLLPLLSGCYNYRELNELGITTAVSIDYKDNNFYVIAEVINPIKQQDASSSNNSPFVNYNSSSSSLQDAFRKVVLESPRQLYAAQLEIIVLSEEVVNNHLEEVLEYFARDPESRTEIKIIVAKTEDSTKAITLQTLLTSLSSSNIINSLDLQSKVLGMSYPVTLNELLNMYIDPYLEVVLPSMTLYGNYEIGDEKENITTSSPKAIVKIDGSTITKDNKILGYLDLEESKILNLINGKLKETIIKKKVIEAISSDLSKPLRRYDSEIEYVPTQLICEYCRRIVDSEGATADGITFESSLHKGGRNYVLFDESAAKCIRVDSHEITRIDIDRK